MRSVWHPNSRYAPGRNAPAAADAIRREIGFEFQADALPAARFEAAWQKGSTMSLEEAASYALEEEIAS